MVRGRIIMAVCLLVGATGLAAGACSAGGGSTLDDDDDNSTTTGEGGITFTNVGGGTGGILQTEPNCDGSDPNDDGDGDGWTDAAGDCNDCTEQMNPGALDYDGNNIDEDCNGAPDDTPTNCDSGLNVASNDPMDGARAMGLCKATVGESWGVITAEYLTADLQPLPDPLGHGILGAFGPNVNPQEGTTMFAISSGTARQPSDPGYQDPGGYDKMYTTGTPPGYPKEFAGCPAGSEPTGEAHDSAALRLTIRTPTNAKSLRFNVNFYTWEYPGYICTEYNDFVVAMLSPTPPGQPDGNISFDIQGNPLSVNAGFLEVCACPQGSPPCDVGGKTFQCALGTNQLIGTGFEDHAATGWLETTTTILDPGGNIELLFAAWDSGDGILDSTGLFDNFTFEVDETPTETQPVPTPR